MKPRLILILFLFLIVGTAPKVLAQHSQQHSLYMVDKYKQNPAYGGLDRSLSINLNYRSQWNNLPGQPKQFYVNGHLPIYLFNGSAGMELYTDNTGVLNTTGLTVSYNYVQPIFRGLLSGGLRIGLEQNTLDGSAIVTPDGTYGPNTINHNDPLLTNEKIASWAPVWQLGGFIGHDLFDAGLTISNIFPDAVSVGDSKIKKSFTVSAYGQVPFYIGEYEIAPSLLIKTNGDILQTDISCLLKNGNIFGGLSLRGYNDISLDALVFIGGIRLNQHYTLSYSYDAGLSDIKNVSQGTHEVNINYNLNKRIGIGLPPEIIYNPRNL